MPLGSLDLDVAGPTPWDIMVPDAVLPVQLLHARPIRPEARLLLAVLEDGVRCALLGTGKRLHLDAREWIRVGNSRLFGFRWICEHLDLDADALAAGVLARAPIRLDFRRVARSSTARVSGRILRGRGRVRRVTRGHPMSANHPWKKQGLPKKAAAERRREFYARMAALSRGSVMP